MRHPVIVRVSLPNAPTADHCHRSCAGLAKARSRTTGETYDQGMTEEAETEDGDGADGPSAPLSTWERTLAGVLGLLMVGAGTTAVFMRSVEAGPTALVTIGAVLFIIAISGVSIKRAKFGDNEITMNQRRAAFMEIADAPADELQTALSVMAAYDPAAVTDPSVRLALAGAYESTVLGSIKREYGDRFTASSGRGGDTGIDGFIEIDGARIDIEIRYQTHLWTRARYRNIVEIMSRSNLVRVILITNKEFSRDSTEQMMRAMRERNKILRIVVWSEPDDIDPLRRAVTELLE